MRAILEELFFGNIDPNTQYFKENSAYSKAIKTISDNEEKLTTLLDGSEKSLFLSFANAHSELNGITAVDKFVYGFRLGARIMIEVMGGDDVE